MGVSSGFTGRHIQTSRGVHFTDDRARQSKTTCANDPQAHRTVPHALPPNKTSAMCQALPSTHPCGHPSYLWSYCPESGMSGEGGVPPDCDQRNFSRPATPSAGRCPLVHCRFVAGSSWYVLSGCLISCYLGGASIIVTGGNKMQSAGGPSGLENANIVAVLVAAAKARTPLLDRKIANRCARDLTNSSPRRHNPCSW